MPLLRIQKYPGFKQVLQAGEGIADLATIELVPGGTVKMGKTGDEQLAAGVALGAVVSGELVRFVTQGIVSGVKTGEAVQAGDRLTVATSGRVVPLNYGLILASGLLSGLASGLQGPMSGSVLTGRVLGRALTSGASGLGIQVLVTVGG